MDVPSYHLNFVTEEYDENGMLKKFGIKYPDNFNYAYDIIDKYGEMEPDRRALMWVDLEGNEKLLTYGDLSRLSTQAANMYRAWGIRKGDKVMLVLKRNYQYWYAILGLMKLGAIAIPATHMLTTKDFQYRFQAADVSAVIATAHAEAAHYIDEADELLSAAVEVVLETGQASVSMLQRRLKLGYSRAARIVDEMEQRGIVGPFEGSKPRQLLVTREKWEEIKMRGGLGAMSSAAMAAQDAAAENPPVEEEIP